MSTRKSFEGFEGSYPFLDLVHKKCFLNVHWLTHHRTLHKLDLALHYPCSHPVLCVRTVFSADKKAGEQEYIKTVVQGKQLLIKEKNQWEQDGLLQYMMLEKQAFQEQKKKKKKKKMVKALFILYTKTINSICIWIILYLFNKYLLSTCYMPVTIRSIRNIAMNKTDKRHCP